MVKNAMEKRDLAIKYQAIVGQADGTSGMDDSNELLADTIKNLGDLISSMAGDASRIARVTGNERSVYKKAVQLRKTSNRVTGILQKLLESTVASVA